MTNTRMTTCVMAVVLSLASSPVLAAIQFRDGKIHDIDYHINASVWVDYQAPGMQTTVNWLDGASTGAGGELEAYCSNRVTVSGGSIDNDLWIRGNSIVTVSGGSIARWLYAYGGQVTVSGGTIGMTLLASGSAQVTILGGSIGEGLWVWNAVSVSGGLISGDFRVDYDGILTLHGSGFAVDGNLVGYGELTSIFGGTYEDEPYRHLTGTLTSGDPIANNFRIGHDSKIVLIHQPAMIYYVDADANGLNDGSSWTDAYNYLQDALAGAVSGDEIWVAQGIYKPDQGVGITPGDRTATFQLINGVAISGGYAGFGEPDADERDIDAYETILSGDLDGNDIDVNDRWELWDEPSRAENSLHVVTGNDTDSNAVLDGFSITAGNDNRYGPPQPPVPYPMRLGHGAGMCNHSGSPTLANCTFIWNTANGRGGGMCNEDESSPTLTKCTFTGNSASTGGAMYTEGSNPSLVNCTFNGNLASRAGGGITNYLSEPTLTNCMFTGNKAGEHGGGMYNYSISLNITNCTFIGNSARQRGGAVYIAGISTNQTLTNCIFIDNSAYSHGGAMVINHCNPTLINCTFRNNKTESYRYGGGGILCDNVASPTLINCEFTGNVAQKYGGGMYNKISSSPTLWNCTFIGNSGGNFGGGICNRGNSNPTLTNCIIWGNKAQDGPQIYLASDSYASVNYSDTQGGEQDVYVGPGCALIWDEGNIDADPCFVDPGYWGHRDDPNIVVEPNDPNAVWVYGDYHLLGDSPCIDAGDPNYMTDPNETDLDGRPRVIGGRIDMGAYEYSPAIPAEVRIVPRSINLASSGKWITCYIWLGEDYDVADIDPNSVLLEDEIEAESLMVYEQEQVVVARFSRSEVQGILAPGEVELSVSGELTDGTRFEENDIIRVIDKGGKK